MANNRLYIVCKECNGFRGLLKYYPPKGFIAGDQGWYFPEDNTDSLDEWIKEHEVHAAHIDYQFGEYFAFVTEQDDRVELIDFEKRKVTLKN